MIDGQSREQRVLMRSIRTMTMMREVPVL